MNEEAFSLLVGGFTGAEALRCSSPRAGSPKFFAKSSGKLAEAGRGLMSIGRGGAPCPQSGVAPTGRAFGFRASDSLIGPRS